jgi:hypothetical protein
MRFENFAKRNDLCCTGQSKLYRAQDAGVIVKVGSKWFASNDIRYELIGIRPNEDLVAPTVGPYRSAKEAFVAYKKAWGSRFKE